jgi:homoserine O-acetyltransferase
MGGMAVLEWPLCTPAGYVKHVIPLATSARHSAWCISWGEAQRQSIYADPAYNHGFYTTQPCKGLAAARMSALLTYRSRDSFESRFGRRPQVPVNQDAIITPPRSPVSKAAKTLLPDNAAALAAHNDGHRPSVPTANSLLFSAQSYLRYQGDKFTARFDANCYIHITRKMDTHDVTRGRIAYPADAAEDESPGLACVLSTLPPRALVISIETDGLFMPSEQRELAAYIPDAALVVIPSRDGHDGFLLEFEQINGHILAFLRREFPELYERVGEEGEEEPECGFEVTKTSVFGEAEVDITRW